MLRIFYENQFIGWYFRGGAENKGASYIVLSKQGLQNIAFNQLCMSWRTSPSVDHQSLKVSFELECLSTLRFKRMEDECNDAKINCIYRNLSST